MKSFALVLAGTILGSLLTILAAPGLRETARDVTRAGAPDDGSATRGGRDEAKRQAPSAPGLTAPPASTVTRAGSPPAAGPAGQGPAPVSPAPQEEDAVEADSQREIPLTQLGALRRAGRMVAESGVYGDSTRYDSRLSLSGAGGKLLAREGSAAPPGRLSPWDMAGFAARTQGREPTPAETSTRSREAWELFAEENRVLAAIAKRTQAVIDARVSSGTPSADVVAVELRGGTAYVVRRGEDAELDRLLVDLDALKARREAFSSPVGR